MDACMCGCGAQQNGSWVMFKAYKGTRKYLCYGFVNCYNCAILIDTEIIRDASMKYTNAFLI